MLAWVHRFEGGTDTTLQYSQIWQVTLPPNIPLRALIVVAGFTIQGRAQATANPNDEGDPYVWPRIIEAGGQSLATQNVGGYPAFTSNPQIWTGTLPEQTPTIKFQVQSHLVDAVVIAQVFEIDQITDPAPWTVVSS